MKIAIVHEWFVSHAGSEKVVEQILKVFPEADLFAVIDFLPEDKRDFILNKSVNTTFIQKLPFAKKKYRNYLPLMPFAIEQLDLSDYDIIFSSSHAVAKGVITGPDQLHISYVHSPIRYAWDLQNQYLKESGLTRGFKSFLVRLILHNIRIWDVRTANGVDYFIANSNFIKRRIWKVYRRKAEVIYPPVDVNNFKYQKKKSDYYLTASRMVPYKKIDVIVDAFTNMPDKKLVVIGDGPDFNKIKKKAGNYSNIQLLGYQSFDVLREYMANARAFVFAAEEDFGIIPVEAQACGTPVIAYGKGGALETVRSNNIEEPTGLFFNQQTVESITKAIEDFEENIDVYLPEYCRKNAMKFSETIFRKKIKTYVDMCYKEKEMLSNH
ncbi:glycosyltransferase family 4 protein [Sporolactobacillus spathodeae]|uniref:Glycosyltransferase involved in cell wall biosynthesis n=1 Tax=Sporolactobacillus spathodeae TaxID=1465502 RepID=A0ABS2Q7N0_9BACL|nr:glycosyltransferase family 4 protein [Sporolactobacillus spathodeae]MBM7657794.1 glycosyltransferase involved in cell wall biosynthesis [Sporolactobacillus spathodeae]